MNRPRTTENFPRMKDRAAGRRARRFVAALPRVFDAIRDMGQFIADAIGRAVDAIVEVVSAAADALRSSYALAPPPLPLHAAIDDPEGRELVAAILERKKAAEALKV